MLRRDPARVFFGILPVGLAWHLGFAVLSSLVMAALVRFAWPTGVDADDDELEPKSHSTPTEHAP